MKNIIFAVGSNGEFGLKGGLPWEAHDTDDMNNFKTITKASKNILMASKTFDSLPFILPSRHHIVVSSKLEYISPKSKDITYINPKSQDFAVLDLLLQDKGFSDYCIIGGKSLIESAIKSSIDFNIYVTVFENNFEADVFIDLTLLEDNGYSVCTERNFSNCKIIEFKRR